MPIRRRNSARSRLGKRPDGPLRAALRRPSKDKPPHEGRRPDSVVCADDVEVQFGKQRHGQGRDTGYTKTTGRNAMMAVEAGADCELPPVVAGSSPRVLRGRFRDNRRRLPGRAAGQGRSCRSLLATATTWSTRSGGPALTGRSAENPLNGSDSMGSARVAAEIPAPSAERYKARREIRRRIHLPKEGKGREVNGAGHVETEDSHCRAAPR